MTTAARSTPLARTLARTWPSMERPARACRTFGSADFMRVPSPAARTTAVTGLGIGGSLSIAPL
jgi:hypothetical protein